MKKTLIITGLLTFSVFLLSACGNKQVNDEQLDMAADQFEEVIESVDALAEGIVEKSTEVSPETAKIVKECRDTCYDVFAGDKQKTCLASCQLLEDYSDPLAELEEE